MARFKILQISWPRHAMRPQYLKKKKGKEIMNLILNDQNFIIFQVLESK